MKPSTAALILAALAALFAIALQTARLDRAQHAALRAGLAADTLVASRDTTRALSLKLVSLGESLAVAQRRAMQIDQRADALDRALGLDRAARDSVTASIASYHGIVRTDTVFVGEAAVVDAAIGRPSGVDVDRGSSDSVRRGTFDVRQPPYAVHAVVALPDPPARGSMALAIALDTLRLDVRLGCGAPNASGVRAASAIVSGPAWAGIQLGRVEQAPEVCNVGAATSRAAALKAAVSRIGVSVGYVAGVGSHGQFLAGPGVMIGVKLWP